MKESGAYQVAYKLFSGQLGQTRALFPDMSSLAVRALIAVQTCWERRRAIMQAWSDFIVGP